jgi:hypothetical protein
MRAERHEQALQESPRRLVVRQMMGKDAGRLVRIGAVREFRAQMPDKRAQACRFARKAPRGPIHEIDMPCGAFLRALKVESPARPAPRKAAATAGAMRLCGGTSIASMFGKRLRSAMWPRANSPTT